MTRLSLAAEALRDKRVASTWAALPVIVGAYLLLAGSQDTLLATYGQVVFQMAPALFCAFAAAAAWSSEPHSRLRVVWGLLAAGGGLALISGSMLSFGVVAGGLSEWMWSVFGLTGAMCSAAVVLAMAVASGVDRRGWRSAVRIVLDVVALSSVCFGLAHYVTVLLAETLAPLSAVPVMRVAAFATLGVVLMALDISVYLASGPRKGLWTPTSALGVGALSLGAVVYGGVLFTGNATTAGAPLHVAAHVLFIVGYYVMFLSAFMQVAAVARKGRHHSATGVLTRLPTAPGIVTATLLFFGVVLLGAVVVHTPTSDPHESVYLAVLALSVVCLALRSAAESEEAEVLAAGSMRDALTGLPGSRAIDEKMGHALAESRRNGVPVGVFVVDVDDFAAFNASNGYRRGDRALRGVADSLLRQLGPQRDVLRLSGDEFVVIGPVQDSVIAEAFGNLIRSAIRDAVAGEQLGASVGVALFPEHGDTQEALLRAADRALAWAKRHGKGRVQVYETGLAEAMNIEERLAEGDEGARMSMARALCAAADARDPANHTHSRNVAALVRLFAESMGFDEEHTRRLETAGVLHDVGKIALPDQMLGGRTLSIRQRDTAREHSELGERLAKALGVEGVPAWIRSHHERWDGNGFPDGLSGEDIPLESRIIALADAYDTLTAGSRYGAPLSKAAALQEIDLGMGVRFDPDLAERFIVMVGSTGALGWSDDWDRGAPA